MEEIKPQGTLIRTNEILLKDSDRWLYFSRPRQLVAAETLHDVQPAFEEIERLIKAHGLYAAGFLSYEAASGLDPVLRTRASMSNLNEASSFSSTGEAFPFLWFGLYPGPRTVSLPGPMRPKEKLTWQPTTDRKTYDAAIARIRDYIAEGRTYQVNYTIRLRADFNDSAWDFFLHLAQSQNNYAAYVDTGRSKGKVVIA